MWYVRKHGNSGSVKICKGSLTSLVEGVLMLVCLLQLVGNLRAPAQSICDLYLFSTEAQPLKLILRGICHRLSSFAASKNPPEKCSPRLMSNTLNVSFNYGWAFCWLLLIYRWRPGSYSPGQSCEIRPGCTVVTFPECFVTKYHSDSQKEHHTFPVKIIAIETQCT